MANEKLPEVGVALTRIPASENAITSKYPESLGQRTKFGGDPDWIQNEEVPLCKTCGKSTVFIGQIDSFDHFSLKNPNADFKNLNYMFGDVGMIYVFFCPQCLVPEACFQQY